MTFKEVCATLKAASGVFCKPGTERVAALCARLSHPERALRVIHVTGTNGKGSTSLMLSSVLSASGYRVGQFSSPYLLSPTECIRIGDAPIDKRHFSRIAQKVFIAAEEMEDAPTEFELLTAIAYLAFYESDVDVAVVEVGMGGRLDATNIIERPLLSIITGVSVDHTAFLGSTLAEIASIKAGIIKAGAPVLYGGDVGEAETVIRREAEMLGAPFFKVQADRISHISLSVEGTRFSFDGMKSLSLSLLGTYQVKNAACALTALTLLRDALPRVCESSIRQGLASARWAGRFERLLEHPPVYFDGAHNPEGIAAAVSSIRTYFKEGAVLVGGVLRDKDYRAIAPMLASVAHTAFTVTPKNPRALDAKEYAAVLCEAGIAATPCKNVKTALQKAISFAEAHALPVVCLGSLYLYRAVTQAMKARK